MRSRCVIVFVAVTLIAAGHVAQAQDTRGPMVVAEGGAYSDPQAAQAPAADAEENLSPEEKMRRRFPQPVRVGDLIGLPLLDWDDSTIGYVRHVVRTPERPAIRLDQACSTVLPTGLMTPSPVMTTRRRDIVKGEVGQAFWCLAA